MKNKKCIIKILRVIVFLFVFIAAIQYFKDLFMKNYMYPKKYGVFVEKYAAEYELDENFVYAVIKCESNFDTMAKSSKNARGLMQISEKTGVWAAEEIGLENYDSQKLFDAETNIHIGCWYLKKLINQFGDIYTAAAAYNAGSGNVSLWLKDEHYSGDGKTLSHIPFRETTVYVKKIENAINGYNYLYE